MHIDWLTVGAQAVNFMILVWLLQHFLYRPITRAMDRREQQIKDRLVEAERAKEEADSNSRTYRAKCAEVEQQRNASLAAARQEAEKERKALEREARDAVAARKQAWMDQLDAEREAFLHELRRRSSEQFYLLARRALEDLGDAELEAQIARAFVRQLAALDDPAVARIARAAGAHGDKVAIRSRFTLTPDTERQLADILHRRLGETVAIAYETDETLSCGIELVAGSLTTAWTFASYLDGLERAVEAHLPTASPEGTAGA